MLYTAENYRTHPCPQWYREAGLGIFIHWGLYSVPAFAPPEMVLGDYPIDEHWFSHNPYAEWYLNTLRMGYGPTFEHHTATYGAGFPYENFADLWRAEHFDPDAWARLFYEAGAKYVIPTTKHHDGFCLWDTKYTSYNAAKQGPKRDLIAALAESLDKYGIKLGLYYSGLLDWHFTSYALDSEAAFRRPETSDPAYVEYAFAQVKELIDTFKPMVLWNDIGWPAAGLSRLPELFAYYYNKVPEGVINDRWDTDWQDFYTAEYNVKAKDTTKKWEWNRGVGHSFGYNTQETEAHMLSRPELQQLYANTVAQGGNLLLNIGPRADGTIPDAQCQRLAWLHELQT